QRREIAGILGQKVERAAHLRLDALRRLAEERIRRSFAARHPPALVELDDDDALLGADRARDLEGDLEMDVERVDARTRHAAGTCASTIALAMRPAPAAPSRTGSAAGRPVSCSALLTIWCARSSEHS